MIKKIGLYSILVLIIVIFFALKSPSITMEIPNVSIETELIDAVKNQHWLFTSSKAYKDRLEAHPLVDQAIVNKALPRHLQVKVLLKKPIAAVRSGAVYLMIDNRGIVLEINPEKQTNYVIEGFKVSATEVGHPLVTDNSALIVKAVQLVDLYERFSDIDPDVHLIDGDLVQKINPKFWVNYGVGYDIPSQFNEAMTIYDDMIHKNSNTGIINLSVPGQTVIQTWKN